METIVIEPGRVSGNYYRDLWRYGGLFRVLAWRDVTVRYKQTVIGVLWAVVRPLVTMTVFTIVFGRVAKLPSEGAVPYALMVFAGLLPWTFFAAALSDASNSLVSNGNLITKVYFPRVIAPAASILAAGVDLIINLVLLFALMAWYHVVPGWHLLLLPVFLLLLWLAALGPSLWIAALNVRYRDFRHVVPFLVQVGLYISPVGFSSTIVSNRWQALYALNPLVGVIDGFRWCLLGTSGHLGLYELTSSLIVIPALLAIGIRQFRRMERTFADLI